MLQKISVSKKFLLIFLFNQETRRTQRFLKDHVALKTGVMILKIQICHHRNTLH